jgi:hypothetical protein
MANEAPKVTSEVTPRLGPGGGSTGNKSKSTGMPNTAGKGSDSYGPGGTSKEREKTPSGNKVQAPKKAPPFAGEGSDDYQEPGSAPRKKKAKGKVKSIKELRDLANKMPKE